MEAASWTTTSAYAVQLAATLYLAGLIWFVQLVHYPLLGRVGERAFARYHREHLRRTSWAVALPMLLEAVTSVATALRPPPQVPGWQAWCGPALVALIWISTATLQVPQHRKLERGFDAAVHSRLVATNWIRTVAWSSRALLLLTWAA
ncbi:MAG: hypothetical protein GTO30_20035 [Acidobacteria bacterium]|nr:hypothetical protein [Acidobacteriota bacterium]NIQ84219.1 hypothetical protein [Acidobacteriota bacterium]